MRDKMEKRGVLMIRTKLSIVLGERRWNQADLARATGIRPNTINEIYNDCCKTISVKNLDRICEVLDCDLSDILEYIPNENKTTKNRLGL